MKTLIKPDSPPIEMKTVKMLINDYEKRIKTFCEDSEIGPPLDSSLLKDYLTLLEFCRRNG